MRSCFNVALGKQFPVQSGDRGGERPPCDSFSSTPCVARHSRVRPSSFFCSAGVRIFWDQNASVIGASALLHSSTAAPARSFSVLVSVTTGSNPAPAPEPPASPADQPPAHPQPPAAASDAWLREPRAPRGPHHRCRRWLPRGIPNAGRYRPSPKSHTCSGSGVSGSDGGHS